MAIIPSSRGVVFYDPTHRLYQTSYQANTNLTDFAYTMQDIIDTVNASESVSVETQIALNSLTDGTNPTVSAQMISETVKPGEVIIILGVNNIGAEFGNSLPVTSTKSNAFFNKPIIINHSQYTNDQLFGTIAEVWQNLPTPTALQYVNLGHTGAGWSLKGLWEVSTYVQYAAFADNLHDGTNQTPIHVMTTIGGGNDDPDFLLTNEEGQSSITDTDHEEFIIDSHKFTSEYATRDVTYTNGSVVTVTNDFYTHEVKSKFVINNWRQKWFTLQTYCEGGQGVGPFGAANIYGGVEAARQARPSLMGTATVGTTIQSDRVRVNGVKLSPRGVGYNISNSPDPAEAYYYFSSNTGGIVDFFRGDSAGAGYVILKWLGATPTPVSSYYYYGGNGIGLSNL